MKTFQSPRSIFCSCTFLKHFRKIKFWAMAAVRHTPEKRTKFLKFHHNDILTVSARLFQRKKPNERHFRPSETTSKISFFLLRDGVVKRMPLLFYSITLLKICRIRFWYRVVGSTQSELGFESFLKYWRVFANNANKLLDFHHFHISLKSTSSWKLFRALAQYSDPADLSNTFER